jgi:CRP-like cAMP-binding protein
MRLGSARVEETALVMSIHIDLLSPAVVAECKRELYYSLVGTMKLFTRMPSAKLWQVAGLLALEIYCPDAAVIRQGDPGDKFFLLIRGRVAAFINRPPVKAASSTALGEAREPRKRPSKLLEVGSIQSGSHTSYFGEMAIFDASPRRASIVARDLTYTLVMRQSQFDQLLEIVPDLRTRFDVARATLMKINELQNKKQAWVSSIMAEIGSTQLARTMVVGTGYMQQKANEGIAWKAEARYSGLARDSTEPTRSPSMAFAAARQEIERRAERAARLPETEEEKRRSVRRLLFASSKLKQGGRKGKP